MNFQEIDRKQLWRFLGVLFVIFLFVWVIFLAPVLAWIAQHWFISFLLGGVFFYVKKHYFPNIGKLNKPPTDYY